MWTANKGFQFPQTILKQTNLTFIKNDLSNRAMTGNVYVVRLFAHFSVVSFHGQC